MKEKLYEVCKDILDSEEKTKTFLGYETLDEMYEYFLNRLPELTKDEFDEFICECLENCEKEQLKTEKIDENDLEDVSGGSAGWKTKILSGILALTPILPAVGATNQNAYNTQSSVSQSVSIAQEVKTKISNAYQKTAHWIKKHPKKAGGIAAAIAILTGYGIYRKHENNLKKQREKEQREQEQREREQEQREREQKQRKREQEQRKKQTQEKVEKYEHVYSCIVRDDDEDLKASLGSLGDIANLNRPCYQLSGIRVNTYTPLEYAARNNKPKCLKVMIDAGADVAVALSRAAECGSLECLKVLLERGANINTRDRQGWTPLMKVADRHDLNCVQTLLDKGADVHARSGEWTALILAATKNHYSNSGSPECVKALLNSGQYSYNDKEEIKEAWEKADTAEIKNLIKNKFPSFFNN